MRKEEERLNEIQNETKLEKEKFEEYVKFFENNKQKIIREKEFEISWIIRLNIPIGLLMR